MPIPIRQSNIRYINPLERWCGIWDSSVEATAVTVAMAASAVVVAVAVMATAAATVVVANGLL
jgi:hypothetical protein